MRRRHVESIFLEALRRPVAARDAYVEQACGADRELFEAVRLLLQSHRSSDTDTFDLSAHPSVVTHDVELEATPRIPGFSVGRLLGRGASGDVFEARQIRPRRTVAIKVLRDGRVSPKTRHRFAREADVLAHLRHPSIAEIHSVDVLRGADGEEWPYYVMEYVEGAAPIDAYVAREKLDVRRRLELFLDVCAAVEHAHARRVVHRDLKPANLLVDGAGQVKVIDFGVARILEPTLLTASESSTAFSVVGTLPYLAPEQFSGHAANERSDVYSLGVVLHEILAGRLPWAPEPTSILDVTREFAAGRRRTRLSTTIPTDLRAIITKAVRFEPVDRYDSVRELADDIRRHLGHEEVLACPLSVRRRIVLWLHRHRIAAAVAFAIFLLAVIGIVLRWQVMATVREAERDRNDATFLLEATSDLLLRSDPRSQTDHEEFREELDELTHKLSQCRLVLLTAAKIHGDIGHLYATIAADEDAEYHVRRALDVSHERDRPPQERRRLRRLLAKTLTSQGRLDEAEAILQSEVDACRVARHERDLVEALLAQATVIERRGRFSAATPFLEDALRITRRDFVTTPSRLLRSLSRLARNQARRHDPDTETTYSEALVVSADPTIHPLDAADLFHDLAQVRLENGRGDDAHRLLRQELERRTALQPPTHSDIAHCLVDLGGIAVARRDAAKAEKYLAPALTSLRRRHGDRHPALCRALGHLALLREAQGRLSEAHDVWREAESSSTGFGGDEVSVRAHVDRGLGSFLRRRLRPREALPYLRRAVEGFRTSLEATHPSTMATTIELAWTQLSSDDADGAGHLLDPALRDFVGRFGPDHMLVQAARNALARVRLAQRRFDEAEGLVQAILEKPSSSRSGVVASADAEATLGRIEDACGDGAAARAAFVRALGGYRLAYGPDHLVTVRCELVLGAVLADMNAIQEALPLLRRCERILDTDASSWRPDYARALQGWCLVRRGRVEEGIDLLDEGIEALEEHLPGRATEELKHLRRLRASCPRSGS